MRQRERRSRPTSEQGAGLGRSEGIITGGDPHQQRVLGGILQTEVPQLSSSLGHLQSQTQHDVRASTQRACDRYRAPAGLLSDPNTSHSPELVHWLTGTFVCIKFASNGEVYASGCVCRATWMKSSMVCFGLSSATKSNLNQTRRCCGSLQTLLTTSQNTRWQPLNTEEAGSPTAAGQSTKEQFMCHMCNFVGHSVEPQVWKSTVWHFC